MEVKINREIRDYQESIFFGLNLRIGAPGVKLLEEMAKLKRMGGAVMGIIEQKCS